MDGLVKSSVISSTVVSSLRMCYLGRCAYGGEDVKEFIASILIALGIVQSALPCEPPTVCTDGLIEQERIEMLYTEEEVIACAKLIYGEYGADWVSDTEKAKVVCTLVNRTHSGKWVDYVGSSELMAQLTAQNQFYYHPSFPVTERHYRIAYDVLWRASQIEQGCEGIKWECDTLSYWGDGSYNHFY